MGWGGGGENYDELWTEIFNIPVILGVIIVLFLFSERQTCPPRLLICCYFQPYKFGGGVDIYLEEIFEGSSHNFETSTRIYFEKFHN